MRNEKTCFRLQATWKQRDYIHLLCYLLPLFNQSSNFARILLTIPYALAALFPYLPWMELLGCLWMAELEEIKTMFDQLVQLQLDLFFHLLFEIRQMARIHESFRQVQHPIETFGTFGLLLIWLETYASMRNFETINGIVAAD